MTVEFEMEGNKRAEIIHTSADPEVINADLKCFLFQLIPVAVISNPL